MKYTYAFLVKYRYYIFWSLTVLLITEVVQPLIGRASFEHEQFFVWLSLLTLLALDGYCRSDRSRLSRRPQDNELCVLRAGGGSANIIRKPWTTWRGHAVRHLLGGWNSFHHLDRNSWTNRRGRVCYPKQKGIFVARSFPINHGLLDWSVNDH